MKAQIFPVQLLNQITHLSVLAVDTANPVDGRQMLLLLRNDN